MLIGFIYYPVGIWVEKRLGRAVSISTCLILLAGFGILLFLLLSNSLSLLQEKLVGSREKLLGGGERLLQYVGNYFGFGAEEQTAMMRQFYENLLGGILPLVKDTISLSASSLAGLMLIPIFVALVLNYRELLVKFTLLIVPDKDVEGFKATLREMTSTYFKFAKGMGLVYLIVGTLNSLGFYFIGLPNAVYLGVLAALLTFFPYVGIMIGGSVAIVVAWTTFDSVWQPLGVVAVLSFVQYLEANVIFPMAVGHQLKINTLATLIAIIIGGLVWGGAGMILFVPFAAILKILADKVEALHPLSVLLGQDASKESKTRWHWNIKVFGSKRN